MSAYQTCRVCGVRVPAGFTNCDGCFHKTDDVKKPVSRFTAKLFIQKPKPVSVPGKSESRKV